MLLLSWVACDWSRYELDQGSLDPHRQLTHQGRARRYALFTSTAGDDRPLVLLLHGAGDDLTTLIADPAPPSPMGGPWIQTAEAEGFHLLMPEGVDGHWNDCRTDCPDCPETVDDSAFLLALLDQVQREVRADPDRIYVTGASDGGRMALRLARDHDDRIAAISVVTASEPATGDCGAPPPLPVQFIVGTEDPVVPWSGGFVREVGEQLSIPASIDLWKQANGCTGSETLNRGTLDQDPDDGTAISIERHACPAGTVELVGVEGGGHFAPSVLEPVSPAWEPLLGRQSHEIEAATESLAFFLDHPRVR